MAVRPVIHHWARLVWRGLGGAAVLVAAQLGAGRGLGIIDWDLGLRGVGNGWSRLLTWVAFLFSAAVLGGVAWARSAIRSTGAGVRSWITAVVAAGSGAAAAFPLVWLPVWDARPSVDPRPELTIAITSAAGIVVGIVLAIAALACVPVARGVAAGCAWVWLFAVVSTALMVARNGEVSSPRVGMIDVPGLGGPGQWWLGPNLMIVVAGILGAGVAWMARRAGAPRLVIALSGLAPPALVACGYVIAGPGFGDQTDQLRPYLSSLVAAGVGLLAATGLAMTQRRSSGRKPPVAASPIADREQILLGHRIG